MNPNSKKRQVDFQVIARWVEESDRVLDLGCGRGLLLEYLMQKKSVYGVGVDIDFDRVLGCIRRGVPAYHGDVGKFLATFPDKAFNRVILSRSVDLLDSPDYILEESLRVGRAVTVGFVNNGFWKTALVICCKAVAYITRSIRMNGTQAYGRIHFPLWNLRNSVVRVRYRYRTESIFPGIGVENAALCQM